MKATPVDLEVARGGFDIPARTHAATFQRAAHELAQKLVKGHLQRSLGGAFGLPKFTGSEPAPMSVDAIVGQHADLRGTQVVGAEGIAGEAMSGTFSEVLPHMKGVATDRAHPDYSKAIGDLARADVGGPTGAMDRAIVADLLFAEGAHPTFVSVDSNVVSRLASNFGEPIKMVVPRGETIANVLQRTYPDGTFTIKVQSRTLTVRFE